MNANPHQAAIILPIPAHARYLSFDLVDGVSPASIRTALKKLAPHIDGKAVFIGIGAPVAEALGKTIDGLRAFSPNLRLNGAHEKQDAPAAALWLWLRGGERGDLLATSLSLVPLVQKAFVLRHAVDGFAHHKNRDLTGYEDGTENPKGKAALRAATFDDAANIGMHGSSYVAVQQWLHQLDRFNALKKSAQDNTFGRERISNDELGDAPKSAHTKRTEQESFSPQAFVVRRSMPWADGLSGGLVFVAFGHSFDAFEAQWRRMLGLEDGIKDALFRFTQPVSHDYFWCPPMCAGQIDFRALGI